MFSLKEGGGRIHKVYTYTNEQNIHLHVYNFMWTSTGEVSPLLSQFLALFDCVYTQLLCINVSVYKSFFLVVGRKIKPSSNTRIDCWLMEKNQKFLFINLLLLSS